MADIQWALKDVIEGDNEDVLQQKLEIEGYFWTWFGGYKGLLADNQKQAAVLIGLDKQRGWAVDLVSEVSQHLKELKYRLGDLRIRIQQPGFDLSDDLESQIEIIQKGVDALTAGRAVSRKSKKKTMKDIKRQVDAQMSEIGAS